MNRTTYSVHCSAHKRATGHSFRGGILVTRLPPRDVGEGSVPHSMISHRARRATPSQQGCCQPLELIFDKAPQIAAKRKTSPIPSPKHCHFGSAAVWPSRSNFLKSGGCVRSVGFNQPNKDSGYPCGASPSGRCTNKIAHHAEPKPTIQQFSQLATGGNQEAAIGLSDTQSASAAHAEHPSLIDPSASWVC